jgi:hypothetical protein
MCCAHSWVTALFGHEWHIFDNETRSSISYSINQIEGTRNQITSNFYISNLKSSYDVDNEMARNIASEIKMVSEITVFI